MACSFFAESLGTIDYVLDDYCQSKKPKPDGWAGNLVFRVKPELEQKKTVFQIGTADAALALKAAQHVYALFISSSMSNLDICLHSHLPIP